MHQERQHLTRKRQRNLTPDDTSISEQTIVRETNARREFRDRRTRNHESGAEVN